MRIVSYVESQIVSEKKSRVPSDPKSINVGKNRRDKKNCSPVIILPTMFVIFEACLCDKLFKSGDKM